MALYYHVGMYILLFHDASASTDGTAGHRCLRVGCSYGFTNQFQLIRDDNMLEILPRKSRKGDYTFWPRDQVVVTTRGSTVALIKLDLVCPPPVDRANCWSPFEREGSPGLNQTSNTQDRH